MQVESFTSADTGFEGTWEVSVNGAGIDLAYTFIENGDEIVVDLNTNELTCTALTDPATLARRKAAWEKVVAGNGGIHPNCGVADTRLLHRARTTAPVRAC